MSATVSLAPDIPIGLVLDFAGSTAPSGWLLLDGSVISQTIYHNLFAVIGTVYNTGSEGAGNFRLPDCRGRIVIGAGTGSGLSSRTLGQKLGTETHQLTEAELPSHNHTQNPHSHTANTGHFDRDFYGTQNTYGFSTSPSNTGSTTATNNPTGGNAAHNNVMPSLVMAKIIKY